MRQIDGGMKIGWLAHNWKNWPVRSKRDRAFPPTLDRGGHGGCGGCDLEGGAGQQVSFEGLNGFDRAEHLQELR